MKKLLSISLLLLNIAVYSQNKITKDNIDTTDINQVINFCFEKLHSENIPTGFLYDKVPLPVSGIENFNGLTDSVIKFEQWEQMYFELEKFAALDSERLISFDSLSSIIKKDINQNLVPIGVINLRYNKIKDDAATNGLIWYTNGQLYDFPNSNPSPYRMLNVFAVAPLTKNISGLSATFYYDSTLCVKNKFDDFPDLSIDFGDGFGFRQVSPGDRINISYASGGNHYIISRMELTKNQILESNSQVKNWPIPSTIFGKGDCIENLGNYYPPDETWDIEYEINPSPLFSKVKGRAYIKYGCGNNRMLKKPFIFVEGIDFGDANNIDRYGDVGWDIIITGGKNTDYYDLFKDLPLLFDKLCRDGYDIVMLDFKDGATKIEYNSELLILLLRRINSTLLENDSDNQNVILGASMGGQVSRYALNKMEMNNEDHNTRLWIAYDSPNEGANISLGTQYAIKFTAGMLINTAFGAPQLLRPATKQLLLFHYNPTLYQIRFTPTCDPLRTSFINSPYMQGYPQKPYKVAIACGSGYGSTQGYNPGDKLIDINNINFTTGVLKEDVWSLPNNTDNAEKIFEGFRGYFFLPIGFIIWQMYDLKKVINSSAYDNTAGGNRSTMGDFVDGLEHHIGGSISNPYRFHSFIPIGSALGMRIDPLVPIEQTSVGHYYNACFPYVNDALHSICPFDQIYYPHDNQEHVQITLENINWFYNTSSPNPIYIQNKIYSSGNYTEDNRYSIIAGFDVNPTLRNFSYVGTNYNWKGDVNVNNGSNVVYKSNSSIQLKRGFFVGNGGNFTAKIIPYPCSLLESHRTLAQTEDIEEETKVNNEQKLDIFSIIKESENPLKIFPNPSKGFLEIQFYCYNFGKYNIDILNSQGIVIYRKEQVDKTSLQIDLTKQAKGMYFVKVNNKDKIYIQKFIIQ